VSASGYGIAMAFAAHGDLFCNCAVTWNPCYLTPKPPCPVHAAVVFQSAQVPQVHEPGADVGPHYTDEELASGHAAWVGDP
jgi:hypothetical protein